MSATFTPQQQLPDILRQYPQVRPVLDRYGLQGCGGRHGPAESVEFFARSHGVGLEQLIREMQRAAQMPVASAPAARAHFADAAYRPFFIAGMGVFVLLGLVVGTTMLAWMGDEQSFFAPGVHRMNAHANAMVYGFAGMFIMGFGYQALPRFRHTQLWRPSLALASFPLLLVGVLLRFSGEFFGQQGIYEPALAGWGFVAGVTGNLLELAAFSLFALVMWNTLRTDGKLRVYERFVMASAAWFAVSIIFCLALFVATHAAADFGAMVAAVATWQESLRAMQMFGGIGLVVLGVMLRFLPAVFGFRDPGDRLYSRMLWLINAGLILAAFSFPLSMIAKREMLGGGMVAASRGAYSLAMLAVVVGFGVCIAAFAPWRRARVKDRSIKFVRAAHAWLAVTLLLILFEPVYIAAIQGTFGHGYHSGMRHAYTIGFMTMMVVAVSIKVVPNLNGVDPSRLRKLWAVFVLLNLATLWRVAGEIAGDFDPALLAGLHWSAVLAAAALMLWAAHLLRLMLAPPQGAAPMKTTEITPETRVATVIDTWPQTMAVFVRHGFKTLQNPVARRTIARAVSLAHVCAMSDKDVTVLVRELRESAGLAQPAAAEPAGCCGSCHTEPAVAIEAEHNCGCHGHDHEQGHQHAPEQAHEHACACTSVAEAEPAAPELSADWTVVETARKHPATVAVFAQLRMDACCGGAESIHNSAEHNGLKVEDVMEQLETAIREEHHDKARATGA